MSFDTSQMTYGHLVTYPSVWLPPVHTVKVMLLAHSESQAQDYISLVQDLYPTIDWAFYMVVEQPPYTKEQVDWIWINHFHMNAVIAHAQDAFNIALVSSMSHCLRYVHVGSNETINSLAEFAKIPLYNQSSMIFEHMLPQLVKQNVVGEQS